MMDDRVPAGAAFRIEALPGKGRGMVAAVPLEAGVAVARDHAVELAGEDCDLLERTALGAYYFAHPEDEDRGCLVFGPISLANHADLPSTALSWHRDPDLGLTVEMRTLRPVAAGEELTHRYRCPLWFDAR